MEMALDSPETRRRPAWAWFEWLALAVTAGVLVAFRLHAFDLPLETDECNYAYIGSRLLAGDRLYVDVWDHQPYGVFAMLAGVIALFGDTPEVFRWLACTFSLVSLALVYAIVRYAVGFGPAMVAAALFALVSSDPGTAGEGCNREIYMNAFVLAAWYLAMRAHGRSTWLIFAAGLALGVGSTFKTVLAIHWLALAVWIVVVCVRRAGWRDAARALGLFAAGPALVWVGSFAYFGLTDRWDAFIDAVFMFNLSYSDSSESLPLRLIRFFSPPRHPFIFSSSLPLWIASLTAIGWLIIRGARAGGQHAAAALALVLGSYLAVCLPGRFWPHYYYLLVPAAVIAVGVGLGECSASGARRSWQSWCAYSVVAVVAVALLVTQYRDYLRQPPFGITVLRYNSRDFWGRAHGEHIRRVTAAGDEVFVFGNEAEIYYYSGRRCASRYTMITGLQTGHAGAERRRAELLEELERRLPRIIMVLFDEKPFDGWLAFLERHYGEAVGVDRHDMNDGPIMLVFARRDQPIEAIDWNWDRSEVGGWFPGSR